MMSGTWPITLLATDPSKNSLKFLFFKFSKQMLSAFIHSGIFEGLRHNPQVTSLICTKYSGKNFTHRKAWQT